ncbi:TetR/AcrR family transcriptional regulator [Mechercharimyces sp. CAU 1602]|uniref:TetR/AcrR family transcriptional regulator n=1 Tax=Mechercharimyces sp. CAU 1602 TaxID=2973933 RepID=UPI002163BE4B|nr:TetR/AcrR family transcriptional regulator [Mechercharimyces sp. CAU 1602]MCS1350422.1 TetR/AcrR family transcriptional regulator [Mechercharimyces sp. CAU 1602]
MSTKRKTNREHVTQVAADLFWQHGYHLTTMDEVVKVSNVAKSNIYYHFKTKEELALGVLQWRIGQFMETMETILADETLSSVVKLSSLPTLISQENCTPHHSKGGCPFIALHLQASEQSPMIQAVVKQFFVDLLPVITELIHKGQKKKEIKKELHPDQTARFILASLEGALIMTEVTSEARYMEDYSSMIPHLF